MANNLSGISYTNNFNNLDGLSIVQADELYVDGTSLDPDNIVPYTGAIKTLNMGVQAIKTSYAPILDADVVNLLTLQNAIAYIDGINVANFVKYTGSNQNVDLGSYNLTVGNAGLTSFSNIVKTELNNVLAGYTPASITVGNNFGTITNAGGVYQTTSSATFASLVLGAPASGEKYSVSLSLKSVDTGNTTNLYLYGSTTANMTGSTGQIAGFSIPVNTTGFTVFTNTITFPIGSTYLLLVYYSQKPGGVDTLYWNAFTMTGVGSVVKNLIAPTTSLDGANKGYVDTQDALRVPYTGASANLNLGSNSLIATTAQFTGITSATPTLALGVDGSGNLRSFAVNPNLIPLNNVWTGTNTFNNTLSAFDNQFSVVSTDVGYTGASFSASTGIASITFSSPTYTANSSASVQGILNLPALSSVYVNNPCVAVFTNLSFLLFAVAPYPYFTLTSGSTVVYTSAVNPSGTITIPFMPTSTTLFITIYFKAPPTGVSAPVFSWNTFTMNSYTATVPKLIANGNVGIGTTTPAYKLDVSGDARTTGALTIGTVASATALTVSNSGTVPTVQFNSSAVDSAIDINCTATSGRKYRVGSAGTGTGAGVGNFFVYDATALATRMVINSTGKMGIGTITPTAYLNVFSQAYQTNQFIISGQEFYQTSQSSTGIALNVGVNRPGNKQLWISDPDLAINSTNCNFRITPQFNGTYIDSVSTDGGTGKILYVSGYPLILNSGSDKVGVGTTTPVAKLDVVGTAAINNGSNYANTSGYMASGSLTIGGTTANYGSGYDWNGSTAGLLLECLDNTEIAVHDAGARVASFMQYTGSQNTFYMGRLMGTGWGNATYVFSGIVQCSVQPRCRLYGAGGYIPINLGAVWGSGNTLLVGSSAGMSNVIGNGWDSVNGVFYAPQTGRYQINITFYWNLFVAGNRLLLKFFTSGGVNLGDQYACIEGAGIGADTVRQYSTMLLMPAGSYFYLYMASGSNGSASYFSNYEHSQMSIYMVH
jgi:hypothetical protein